MSTEQAVTKRGVCIRGEMHWATSDAEYERLMRELRVEIAKLPPPESCRPPQEGKPAERSTS